MRKGRDLKEGVLPQERQQFTDKTLLKERIRGWQVYKINTSKLLWGN